MPSPTFHSNHRLSLLLILLFLCSALHEIIADTTNEAETYPLLHPIFSEHMVLQRDHEIRIWGWAAPATPVTVSLNGKTARGQAQA
ncbi:MAG: hypothetical protein D6820_14175, partial [Lentisphaerae bacterium]